MAKNLEYDLKTDIEYISQVLNISKTDLAKELGLNYSTIFRWINNKTIPEKRSIESIYDYAYKNDVRINKIYSQLCLEENNPKTNMIIYHGSKRGINGKLSLEYSKSNNDFGIGMYFGESLEQSESFVYQYNDSAAYIVSFYFSNLSYIKFEVNLDWMLTVAYFRGYLNKYKDSSTIKKLINKINNVDYIIAPIADNNMFDIIESFANGDITTTQCEHALTATSLGDQIVIKSEKALKNIKLLKKCYISKSEKDNLIKMGEERRIESDNKVKLSKSQYNGKGKYIDAILSK